MQRSTLAPYVFGRPLSCSVSYSRHDDRAFRPMLGRLAPQFLHACSDHRKIVSSALAAQLLYTRADRRKIVSGTRAGHVSSVSWSQGRAELYSPRRRQYPWRPSCGARAQCVDLRRARKIGAGDKRFHPRRPGGGHSQDGTVLDAAAGDAVDDDAPALVGAVNVVTAGDVELEGIAVIAGKLTTPPVVRLAPAVVAAVCAVAGLASAIRSSKAMRNSRAMALSNSYLTDCYEARASIIPADASARCGSL
jgi:hypothetical protein